MPYATAVQVRAVLAPNPTSPVGTPGELDATVLDERIATAAAQVDAALAARYVVPFTDPVPHLIYDITVGIASWLAALTYRKSVDISATDPLALRYQWATGLLTALATGQIDLPGTTGYSANKAAAVVQPYSGEMFPLDGFGLTNQPAGRIRQRLDPYGRAW